MPNLVLTSAEMAVILERRRQVKDEKFSSAGDDKYHKGELSKAAMNYMGAVVFATLQSKSEYGGSAPWITNISPFGWPWHKDWWKPGKTKRMLVKAAALIIAESERLERLEKPDGK